MPPDTLEQSVHDHFATRLDGCKRLPDLLAFLEDGSVSPTSWDHAEDCIECRLLIEDWLGSGRLFEPAMMQSVGTPAELTPPHRRWLGVLALAVVLLIVGGLLLRGPNNPTEHPLLAKGGWSLEIGVRRGQKTFRPHPGQILRTGDEVGLFYSADQPGFLRVIYVNANWQWVELYPGEGRVGAIDVGDQVRLDAGAVLTEGNGCEAIVGFFDVRPSRPASIGETLKQLRRGPDGCIMGESTTVRIIGVHR